MRKVYANYTNQALSMPWMTCEQILRKKIQTAGEIFPDKPHFSKDFAVSLTTDRNHVLPIRSKTAYEVRENTGRLRPKPATETLP